MVIFSLLTLVFWLALFVVWAISAFSAKRSVRSGAWWRRALTIRIVFIVVVLILFRAGTFSSEVFDPFYQGAKIFSSLWVGIIGVILCGAGVAFAIWARVYLGRNWGMPMTLRVDPELVTSGPYTLVRHPIYTGILLAMLGSIFADGLPWIVAFIFFGIYFIYSAKTEEKAMTKQFPNEYPAYMERSKMLIPFIL